MSSRVIIYDDDDDIQMDAPLPLPQRHQQRPQQPLQPQQPHQQPQQQPADPNWSVSRVMYLPQESTTHHHQERRSANYPRRQQHQMPDPPAQPGGRFPMMSTSPPPPSSYPPPQAPLYYGEPEQNEPTNEQQQQQENAAGRRSSARRNSSSNSGNRHHRDPSLWPRGIGVTDHIGDDQHCPAGSPCQRPVRFTSADKQERSAEHNWAPAAGCMWSWDIHNVDVLGHRLSFEGTKNCCPGCDACCEPELRITAAGEGGRREEVGRVVMKSEECYSGCLSCKDATTQEAKNARGETRFVVRERCCPGCICCGMPSGDWYERTVPVYTAGAPSYAAPIAQIKHRYHPQCRFYHSSWAGFRTMPRGLSVEDQSLLLGMAMVHMWRYERSKNE